MWELYDDLIAEIPEDVCVERISGGNYFAMLEAGEYRGVAHVFDSVGRPFDYTGPMEGRSLKEVAKGVKSWNFKEASYGMMAINAYYNSEAHAKKLGLDAFDATISCQEARRIHNPLNNIKKEMYGKKVAVIGHFPKIEAKMQGICDLHILEMNPQPGDYPASACEYLIPEMDYVFATGMTLANKTLPRLLALKKEGAVFTLVGPSGPLSPALLKHGVDIVAGYVVTDPDHVRYVLSNDLPGLFDGGKMVEYCREIHS